MKLDSTVVDLMFSHIVRLQTWLANEALGAVLVFSIVYMVYRVVKLWTIERNRGTWGDVLLDVSLMAGILAVFLVPSVNLKMNIPNSGQYSFKTPLVIWFPYAVVKTSWDYGDYFTAVAFADEGIQKMSDIPIIWKDDVTKITEEIKKNFNKAKDTVGEDAVLKMGEAAEGNWLSSFKNFVVSIFNKVVHAVSGAVAGVLGAVSLAVLTKTSMGLIPTAVVGALLGGSIGAFYDTFIRIAFIGAIIVIYYVMLVNLLVKGAMYSFTFPVSVVTSVARPARGKDILAQFTAKGFVIALHCVGLVFTIKAATVIYALLDVYMFKKVGELLNSSTFAILVAIFIVLFFPLMTVKTIFRAFDFLQDMIVEAVGTSMPYRMHYSHYAQTGGIGRFMRLPGV